MSRKKTMDQMEFVEAIRTRKRELVLKGMKEGILTQYEGTERHQICKQIFELKDIRMINELAKQREEFKPEYLQMDFSNWSNCQFVQEILRKYKKKFDFDDPYTSEELFEIVCAVRDEKQVMEFIKNEYAVEKYGQLGGAADSIFQVLKRLDKELVEDGQKVESYYQAAIQKNGAERIQALYSWGYDLELRNKNGKNVQDLLRERIKSYQYPKNRTGEVMRKRDQSTVKRIETILKPKEPLSEEKTDKKHLEIGLIIGIVCVLTIAFAGGYYWMKGSRTDSEEEGTVADTNSESYLTDSSLKIEDGDTVNIDYTGYVDGKAFDGGSTDGSGADLTIGSGSYVDDFEEQLIGYHPGDSVTVRVTFPEDYGNEELNGKEAEFDVTINGVYE